MDLIFLLMIPKISIRLWFVKMVGTKTFEKNMVCFRVGCLFLWRGSEGYLQKDQSRSRPKVIFFQSPFSIKNNWLRCDSDFWMSSRVGLECVLIVQAGSPWGRHHLFLTPDHDNRWRYCNLSIYGWDRTDHVITFKDDLKLTFMSLSWMERQSKNILLPEHLIDNPKIDSLA